MPLCTITLLALTPSSTIPQLLHGLSTCNPPIKPLLASLVIRWIILPTSLSAPSLLARNIHWDMLLILPSTTPLPVSVSPLIAHRWSVTAGVPSRLLEDFHVKNKALLHPHPPPNPNPSLAPPSRDGAANHVANILIDTVRARVEAGMARPKSAQDLELSEELWRWVKTFGETRTGQSPLSMLNLLAFKEGMKGEYLKYGEEFARGAGRKRGGVAKIVGSVVRGNKGEVKRDGGKGDGDMADQGMGDDAAAWDEVAVAQYPSIWHFADMLASEDYQDANRRHRVGSLSDTFILCTSEIAVEELLDGGGREGREAKL